VSATIRLQNAKKLRRKILSACGAALPAVAGAGVGSGLRCAHRRRAKIAHQRDVQGTGAFPGSVDGRGQPRRGFPFRGLEGRKNGAVERKHAWRPRRRNRPRQAHRGGAEALLPAVLQAPVRPRRVSRDLQPAQRHALGYEGQGSTARHAERCRGRRRGIRAGLPDLRQRLRGWHGLLAPSRFPRSTAATASA
jgi:hypothetical protein